jgi:ankyrin repeat protein
LKHLKLIGAGANVNERGQFGKTPLEMAKTLKHTEIVDELINAGAK